MTWLVTPLAFILLWAISVRLRDVSVVDALWGPAFAIAPVTTLISDGELWPRRLLVLALVALWGGRLGLHLLVRNHGKPEDYRYAEMRAQHGGGFALRSLFTVFLLQAALVMVISLPLTAVFSSGAPRTVSTLDVFLSVLVLTGVAIEATADLQLVRFRRDPSQCGRVLDKGLWRYSRHPNYFGDAVVWGGLGLFGATSAQGWLLLGSIVGPLLMWVFLLRVSGVTLLEKAITERRPDYARYIQRTSAFVPWRPRSPTRD